MRKRSLLWVVRKCKKGVFHCLEGVKVVTRFRIFLRSGVELKKIENLIWTCIFLVYSKEWPTLVDVGQGAKPHKGLYCVCACWFLCCWFIVYRIVMNGLSPDPITWYIIVVSTAPMHIHFAKYHLYQSHERIRRPIQTIH